MAAIDISNDKGFLKTVYSDRSAATLKLDNLTLALSNVSHSTVSNLRVQISNLSSIPIFPFL
jgi:hypothetical protein